jgi:hypothetical protein
MVLSFGVWLFILGVMGASNLIIAKIPSAKDLIGKLAPYQGWMGVASVFYGVWEVIQCIASLGWMAIKPPIGLIFWILFLAQAVLQIGLGILLGVGVAKTFVKQPVAVQNMDRIVTKLAPFQGILGFAAIGVSVGFLVIDLLFW